MKLKKLSLILCSILLFACKNDNSRNNLEVLINGKITNPIGTSVIFSNKDTSYTTTTNEDGAFAISFMLDSATYLNFEHGVERTAMYVKPGDEIKVSTRRGSIKIKVREDRAIPEGVIFIPFCYNEAAANLLTNPALDPYGKIPEFKYCAAKIEKVV